MKKMEKNQVVFFQKTKCIKKVGRDNKIWGRKKKSF